MKNKNNRWWVLGIICFALLMIVLDTTVVNLAIPQIIKTFGASISDVEWVNSGYLLVFGIFLIAFGSLADKIGRKKMFIIGIATFTLGSLLCGSATSVGQLITYRLIQGLGGAAVMPATLSLIAANFEKKERGLAMGLWSAMAGLGIVLGPIIGGLVTDYGLGSTLNNAFNITEYWRFVFYINVPIGIVAIILAAIFINESKDEKKRKVRTDILGIVTSAMAVFFLVYGLIEGQKLGWWNVNNKLDLWGNELSFGNLSLVPVFFVLSAIMAIIFILVERHRKDNALVDLRLFHDKNFSIANIVGIVLQFILAGAMFLLPLFMQSILGYSAIKSGLFLLPLAIAIMICGPLTGKLSDKISAKYIIIFGLITLSIGLYLLSNLSLESDFNDFCWPFIITGVGVGMTLAPLANVALWGIPEKMSGAASGVMAATRQIGAVMGIAILSAILLNLFPTNLENNIKDIKELPASAQTEITSKIRDKIDSGNSTVGLSKDSVVSEVKGQLTQQAQLDLSKIKDPIAMQKIKAQVEKTINTKSETIGQKIYDVGQQSFTDSFNETILISSIITLLGLVAAMFFNKKNRVEIK